MVLRMIKHILLVEDVEEEPFTGKIKSVVLVDILDLAWDIVILVLIILDDGWGCKVRARKGQGTGRMSFLKNVPRRAKNGFRENRVLAKIRPERPQNNDKQLHKAKIPKRRLR